VKTLLLSILLLPLFSIAQNIIPNRYYFILEDDTIEGFYSDFEIENGKFEQYKVIECQKEILQAHLTTRLPKLHNSKLVWRQIISGEYKDYQPSGEWFQSSQNTDCEGFGGFFSKRTTYLEGDSIQLNYWNYEFVVTSDSSYIKGKTFDGYHFSTTWECVDNKCKIWLKSGSDTLEYSFIEILMHLDAGWYSPMSRKFNRTQRSR
jgi:hypothetical protein